MIKRLRDLVLSGLRLLSLLALASFGTVLLVRCAPGYFTNESEMDAQHGESARQQLSVQRQQEGSPLHAWLRFVRALSRGDLGRSHQYDMPVSTLLVPRLRVTGKLLLVAALPAPLLALMFALPCSLARVPALQRMTTAATLFGVAVPVSVLASAALLSGVGGPALVLLLILAVRDFRFFSRVLRRQSKSTYLLYARACGLSIGAAVLQTVLRPIRRELMVMATLSFVTALSAVIPVEVIFGIPGAGQMAWNAAMNRDLPVLLVVTLAMAACIGLVALTQRAQPSEAVAA